jgi:hypothetical protein
MWDKDPGIWGGREGGREEGGRTLSFFFFFTDGHDISQKRR